MSFADSCSEPGKESFWVSKRMRRQKMGQDKCMCRAGSIMGQRARQRGREKERERVTREEQSKTEEVGRFTLESWQA